jgi:hypothetical protein
MAGFGSKSFSLSIAEWAGIASFLTALLLLFLDTRLSVIPLAGFLLVCAVAPFSPVQFISRRSLAENQGKNGIPDDGPDFKTTPDCFDCCKAGVAATFLSQENI